MQILNYTVWTDGVPPCNMAYGRAKEWSVRENQPNQETALFKLSTFQDGFPSVLHVVHEVQCKILNLYSIYVVG